MKSWSMKNKIIGFTCGAYDMFHVGHLNILRNAKALCDYLVVGVSTDKLVEEYKKHKPVIPFEQRIAIVRAIKYVDAAIPQHELDKRIAHKRLKYDVIFVGSDWDFSEYEDICRVIHFPYTKGISSTGLRKLTGNDK